MNNIYITGDCHGEFDKIARFVDCKKTDFSDIMIVLGDVKINYFEDSRDYKRKRFLSSLPITFLFIHGNHEIRPQNIYTYLRKEWNNGFVYYEEKFPNLLFAEDANIFNLNNKTFFVCGGAYSVDKYYRLGNGLFWSEDEQPSEEIKKLCEEVLMLNSNRVSYILTHTCPVDYLPSDTFRDEIDQSTVDLSTEKWLQEIEKHNFYEKWFCGHYHIDRIVKKINFVFDEIVSI